MTFFSRNCCVLNVLVFSDEIHGETIFVNLNEKKIQKKTPWNNTGLSFIELINRELKLIFVHLFGCI